MRAWYIAIFVAVFGLYLLASSREPAWGDARPMWEVADRLVQHGEIDIKTRWPDDMPPGRNGKTYGIAAIGTVLVHVPGVALTAVMHSAAPRHEVLLRPIFTHLAPAALGALACLLFFGLLRDLGRSARTASLCTAILAASTTVFVYARMPYGEILQVACFVGLFRYTLRVLADPAKRNALWLGLWAGCLFNTKYVYATAIVGAAVLIAWSLRKQRAELKRVVVWASVTAGPLLVLALVYNYLRFGSITKTGYEPYLSWYFGGSIFDGAWGMLASANKSALLYSPPLVLALLGWPRAIRDNRTLGIALAVLVVPTFIVYCTYRSWSGDYAWGPRYFVWTTPVLLVGLAWFVDPAGQAEPGQLHHRSLGRYKRALVAAVVAAGIVVQLLGAALYWDHFIRIAIDTKNQWLGQPNRSGSYIPEKGRGHCDSCFEDTYEILWTPAFQPIKGHWWLVKSIARGDANGTEAQVDAPWRRYTSLEVNLNANYPRARIDWWGLLWLKDATHTWLVGLILLVVFAGTTAFGIWMWIRLHRSGIAGPDAEGSAKPT
ncbi:MAG TPA: glycosyltransferase family 39 protein [Kofleriaceae bacterium]